MSNNNFIKGTIKFYNKDKGYGFIYSQITDKDYYFNIKNIKGGTEPKSGYEVEFIQENTTKGLAAINIKITSTEKSDSQGKVKCPSCGKYMVPRIMFMNAAPYNSVCPFCGAEYKHFQKNGCLFIVILGIIAFIFILIIIPNLIR